MIVLWNEIIYPTIGEFELQIPKGAKMEYVRYARDKFKLFFHANPDAKKETRTFIHIIGGEPTRGCVLIDTYIFNTIPFHLYEIV